MRIGANVTGGEKKPKGPRVEVLQLEPVRQGNLLAHATVRIGNSITIQRMRLIQDPVHGMTTQGPQLCTIGESGEKQYSTLVRLAKPVRLAVRAAILAAWQALPSAAEVIQ